MGALKDLWQSERGMVAIALIIACTVLCAMGIITTEQWLEYTKWIFVTYVAGKTVTTAAGLLKPPAPPAALSPDFFGSLLSSLAKPPPAPPAASPSPPATPS